jgi:hypothetical protein
MSTTSAEMKNKTLTTKALSGQEKDASAREITLLRLTLGNIFKME